MLVLHALSVGLGDCLVIEFPDRSIGIVDCGQLGGAQVATKLLAYLQASWLPTAQPRIRFVLVSHPHEDHDGGILGLLLGIHRPIDEFYYLDVFPPPGRRAPGNWNGPLTSPTH